MDLSLGPFTCIKELHTFFENGYKFHTHAWSEGKNNGVYVKGLTKGGDDDFYGIIQHIYKLEYDTSTSPKRVVLFYCDWFDPTCRGTRVDSKYGVLDIQMHTRYVSYNLFIIAHNVRQQYYVPYPTPRMDKCSLCVTIKMKLRVHIESNDVEEYEPHQVDEMSHANEVIEVKIISSFEHS